MSSYASYRKKFTCRGGGAFIAGWMGSIWRIPPFRFQVLGDNGEGSDKSPITKINMNETLEDPGHDEVVTLI